MAGTGTVKVHNVSLKASEQDISEFFSFSGEIVHVELKRLVPISSP
jgi:RNA recognition motif-containing protein